MRSIFSVILALVISISALSAQQTAPIGPYGRLLANSATQSTATATLTAGQMAGNVHVNVNAGAATLTTPTATLLCRLFPFVGAAAGGITNFSWDWYLVNNGTNTVTVGLGAGVTNVPTGTLTVVAASVKHFLVVLTNCGGATPAAQLVSLGTSVF